ncbi:MAG: apolipoprotein N-acyltransferase, partial [Planctomycetes bacterium]|nr:apolipoprotein N-acyltransferase [Planctomycetota bacterium]
GSPEQASLQHPTLSGLLWPIRKWPRLTAALASAGFLWLCYFPMAWGWLGWVALVPWLSLVRAPGSARRIYGSAWVCGLVFFLAILQWMRVADPRMYATWVGLALCCSLFLPVGLFLIRQLDRHTPLPLVVTVPVVWTALEFLRAHIGTGFPWYFLGHTQHAFLPIIQVSDLGGAYTVSFLVAAVNALFVEWLFGQRGWRALLSLPDEVGRTGRGNLTLHAAGVFLLVAAALGYGFWRLGQTDFAPGPRVTLIQGNLDQRLRNDALDSDDEKAQASMAEHYLQLTYQAVKQQPRPDLIVWPETSHPAGWRELSPHLVLLAALSAAPPAPFPGNLPWMAGALANRPLWLRFLNYEVIHTAERCRTPVLFGVNAYTWEPDRVSNYNAAILVEGDGRVVGRYDKIHRVPFGEYVPFKDWLPLMNKLAPYDFDYSIRPGERLTRFPLGPYHFGMVICYEDTVPTLARQYVGPAPGEPPIDFLLNISNDGWFDGTSEHEEHLAISRFRAVECRRAVGRAVNMGISALIDGNGRVIALPAATWSASKKIPGVVSAVVPLDRRPSLYARWGDWLPWSCWIGILLGFLVAAVPGVGQVANLSN